MTKDEFEREFGTLCAACGKKLENEEFMARAYWYKFKGTDVKVFFNAYMAWIDRPRDKPTYMPTPSQIQDIMNHQASVNQTYIPTPTPKPSLNKDGSEKSVKDKIRDCGNPKAIEAYNKYCCRGDKSKMIEIKGEVGDQKSEVGRKRK